MIKRALDSTYITTDIYWSGVDWRRVITIRTGANDRPDLTEDDVIEMIRAEWSRRTGK